MCIAIAFDQTELSFLIQHVHNIGINAEVPNFLSGCDISIQIRVIQNDFGGVVLVANGNLENHFI